MKLKKVLLMMILCLSYVMVMPLAANAETTGSKAVSEGGKITVSGTATNGTIACAIVVNDANNELVGMETCAVNSDNTYSYTLGNTFSNGTYTVKVADYNGGAFEELSVEVKDAKSATSHVKDSVPKTGTSSPIAIAVIVCILSGSVLWIMSKKKVLGR
ncbi:MAG: LPXTG cell wall anchor domain-containing protein [Lachnospiraceae bacterium]